jgi:hypothetical protein
MLGHPVGEDSAVRQWVLAFHNAVNTRLGRRCWSTEQLDAQYRSVDMLMMGLELREALGEIAGILGSDATCQMLRMVNTVIGE